MTACSRRADQRRVPGGATSIGALPTTTPLHVASGATLDLNGTSQTVGGLSDLSGSGGTVTNSGTGWATLTVTPAGGSATFSGVIQDGNDHTSLTFNGPGTQILTGSNTYSGLTTITAGTLQIGAGGTAGSINSASGIINNGLLVFNRADTLTVAAPISGSGTLNQMGPGRLILCGTQNSYLSSMQNTYTGTTLISGGTLQVGITPPVAPPVPTPVAHYTMDGTVGAINAGDTIPNSGSGGTALSGTMVGTGASYSSGIINQGITLTGSQYIQTPGFGPLNAWTESVWLNLPTATVSTLAYLLDGRNDGSANSSNQSLNNGGYTLFSRIEASGGLAYAWTGGVDFPITPNTWHMLTLTVQTGAYDIYLDGTLQSAIALPAGITPQLMDAGVHYTIGASRHERAVWSPRRPRRLQSV